MNCGVCNAWLIPLGRLFQIVVQLPAGIWYRHACKKQHAIQLGDDIEEGVIDTGTAW